jgi:hypothetical protein
MSPAPVLVQATDTENGCTSCGSQKTVTLHPHHGRRCSDHATLPAGPYDRGLALDMVELGRPDAAFTYLAAHLRREADLRFLRLRIGLQLSEETFRPQVAT